MALDQNQQAIAAGEEPPWQHVCLPMRYEPARAMPDRGYCGDWRKTEGELLFPAVFTEAKVRQSERSLGPRAIRRLKAHRVQAVSPTTNKEARAEPLANAIAYGEVYVK